MTFAKGEQDKHRKAFIEECRQKAWGARCHADWISRGMDQLAAEIEKRQKEDGELSTFTPSRTATSVRPCKSAATSSQEIGPIGQNVNRGQQSLQGLHQSIESNLELAKHAEGWAWKEAEPKSEEQ
jgi:hypothetical protein